LLIWVSRLAKSAKAAATAAVVAEAGRSTTYDTSTEEGPVEVTEVMVMVVVAQSKPN